MDKNINMICFGDFLLEDAFLKSNNYYRYLKIFNTKDIVTFNLETTVSDKVGDKLDKAYNFKVKEKNLNILANGITSQIICHIGNNHIMDFGYECFEDTLNNLKKHNISFTGYSKNLTIPEGIIIKNIKGLNLAFIGAYSNYNVTDLRPGLTPLDDSLYVKVKYAKGISDYVIVHLHWGEELSLSQSPKQIKIAHKLVDYGANIILGHHPHVIQEIERYKNAVIAYSMGNFQMMTYDYDQNSKYGIMLDFKINSIKIDFEIIPLFIENRLPKMIGSQDKVLMKNYKEIRNYNAYYTKNNSWMLFYYHVSKAFYIDSIKAWKRRRKKNEKNLLLKKVKWFTSKKTLLMTFFVIFNIFFNKFHKRRVSKEFSNDT